MKSTEIGLKLTQMVAQQIRFYLFSLLFCLPLFTMAQQTVLKNNLSLKAENERLEDVLLNVAELGGFSFSYNADLIPVDSLISMDVDNASVKTVLNTLLGNELDYRISGNLLVILKTKYDKDYASVTANKKAFTIDGFLQNSVTGEYISNTTVYDIGGLRSTVSDEDGYFSLEIPSKERTIAIGVSSDAFDNAAVVILSKDQNLNIPLIPSKGLEAGGNENPINSNRVDDLKIVKFFADEKGLERSNVKQVQTYRFAQASFLPFVGTNLLMSGTVENQFSLNVIGGYNGANTGLELGGVVNINRFYTRGVQIAGVGNVVGQESSGLQLAGVFNNNLGSVKGVQLAGVANVVLDSIKGMQLAGVINVAEKNVDGAQIAGVTNVAVKDVNQFQLGGVINFGRNVKGAQMAGVMNISYAKVGGLQLAGVMNTAVDVKSIQLAGIMNVAADTVYGAQISSLFNYVTHNRGFQLGMVNMGFDSNGLSMGLLNLYWKGYNKIEFHGNELLRWNARIKLGGNRHFYNIIGLGAQGFTPQEKIWGYSYGFGTALKLGPKGSEINLDLVATDLQDNDTWFEELVINTRLSLQYGLRVNRRLAFFAGPTWSQLMYEDGQDIGFIEDILPDIKYEKTRNGINIKGWYGFEAGIRLL